MSAIRHGYDDTTTGAHLGVAAPGGTPFATYGIQVKGTGGAASSWSVTLEGSLDNTNWTVLITHAATDGSTVWETTGKPCTFMRANVGSLTLGGSATAIHTEIIGVP